MSAEKEIDTLCGLYVKDNAQKGARTMVEILAIVGQKTNIPCLTGDNPIIEVKNVREQGETEGSEQISEPKVS